MNCWHSATSDCVVMEPIKSERVSVHGLGHANLRAPSAMVEKLRRFYIDVIGLTEGPRPQFRSNSRGHWLYAGDTDVLHLSVAVDEQYPTSGNGAFNHLAFACDGLATVRSRLQAAGIAFTVDEVAEVKQIQLFLTDPAGMGVELTFPAQPG